MDKFEATLSKWSLFATSAVRIVTNLVSLTRAQNCGFGTTTTSVARGAAAPGDFCFLSAQHWLKLSALYDPVTEEGQGLCYIIQATDGTEAALRLQPPCDGSCLAASQEGWWTWAG